VPAPRFKGSQKCGPFSFLLPVYLIYSHARSYPAKLQLFADIIRAVMPNLVGMTSPGADALQSTAVGARNTAP